LCNSATDHKESKGLPPRSRNEELLEIKIFGKTKNTGCAQTMEQVKG
jgi:hypothetical protein